MNSQSTTALKTQIRQQIRSQRQSLSATEIAQADKDLCAQFKRHNQLFNTDKVAIYLQHDNEVGTSHLINLLFKKESTVYLPRLYTDGRHQLNFCRYHHQHSEMKNNHYGIAEPTSNEITTIDDLSLIFLPLTAFDGHGNRLGMGGGYYDRSLANASTSNVLIVGLAYDFQQVEQCPVEDFDQPLQMIITPTRVIDFRR